MRVRLSLLEKLSLSAYAGVASLSRFSATPRVPLCLFHAVTGAPCPGCGMTRALLAAWQGRWPDSMRQHPLGLPILAVWTAWTCWGLANFARGKSFSAEFPRLQGAPAWAVLGVVLGAYAARLSAL